MNPRVHMFREHMTGVVPLAWACCGEPVEEWAASTQLSRVTCPACRRIVLRERRDDRKREGGKA